MPSPKMPRVRAERKTEISDGASALAASLRHALTAHRRNPIYRRVDLVLELVAEVATFYRPIGEDDSHAPALMKLRAQFEAAGRVLFFGRCEEHGIIVADGEAADEALDVLCCARRRGRRPGRGVSWVAAFRDLWEALGERELKTSDDALRAREVARRRRMPDDD